MRFRFCPQCGSKLIERKAGDDGQVPFCENCNQYWFDMFSSCSIILVANEFNEVALLRQTYLSDRYCTFVSGFITPGETAEQTAIREVREEIGISLDSLENVGTHWFSIKGILMHCFIGRTRKCDFILSQEVDSAQWTPFEKVPELIFPDSPDNSAFKIYKEFVCRITAK